MLDLSKGLEAKHLKASGCDDATIASAKAAGVPFSLIFQLLMQFGPAAFAIIQQIIDAWKKTPSAAFAKKRTVAAGCCDHMACCEAVVESAQTTLDLAYMHLCECCIDPVTP